MPSQFDVFVSPLGDRTVYPLLVVLQSPFAELAKIRIVAPAVRLQPGMRIGGVLTPVFAIEGEEYVLQTFQLTSVRVTDLKLRVGNIADHRDAITRALDHLFHDNS
jgi:toxin CcdB